MSENTFAVVDVVLSASVGGGRGLAFGRGVPAALFGIAPGPARSWARTAGRARA